MSVGGASFPAPPQLQIRTPGGTVGFRCGFLNPAACHGAGIAASPFYRASSSTAISCSRFQPPSGAAEVKQPTGPYPGQGYICRGKGHICQKRDD